MAYISFEFEQEASEGILTKENIKEGYYLATIIHAMVETPTMLETQKNSETKIFIIVEEIKGLSFYKRFRLWDTTPAVRIRAHKDFKELCSVLDLNLSFDELKKHINFDSDVLIGKQIDACLTRFSTKDGKKGIYISSHSKAGSMSILNKDEVWEPKEKDSIDVILEPTKSIIDDSIPF